jgi:4-amino-4-deoxy-L-arabinose transferase-like glycosyltransferase
MEMPGPLDYLLWLLSFVLQVSVVVYSVKLRFLVRYFPLVFFMLASAVVNVAQFIALHSYGMNSKQYTYVYYYSDSILTVFLYLAVLGLYEHVFREMQASQYIRGGAALLLIATAGFSYLVVHKSTDHLTDRFVVQLGQNLYFVGVVLVYLLWGVLLQLRESRLRILQLALSLGVYFSLMASAYALRHLFPALMPVFRWIPPLATALLPLAWLYTFRRVPEEARLATAWVAGESRPGRGLSLPEARSW